ncbi:MAG: hypothetical protein ACTSPM_01660 [Candidatus Heimdallarchaeota archaeon]
MNKINWICVIIILIIFTSNYKIKGLYELNSPIDTGITHLTWSETEYPDPGEGYSYFNFTIDYYIHNPKLHTVRFNIPYCNLGFMANITVDFVEENLEVYYYPCIGLCAIGQIEVEPGITHRLAGYYLAINETGLTILPDGIYTIWVFCFGVPDVTSNETILVMENGVASITYGDMPSDTIGFQFPSLVLLGSAIISAMIVIRKRRK